MAIFWRAVRDSVVAVGSLGRRGVSGRFRRSAAATGAQAYLISLWLNFVPKHQKSKANQNALVVSCRYLGDNVHTIRRWT